MSGEDLGTTKLPGHVAAIGAVAQKSDDPSNTARQVITTVALDKTVPFLRDGMTVDVDIVTQDRPHVLALTADAIRRDANNKPYVLLVTGGKTVKRTVTLGATNDTQAIVDARPQAGRRRHRRAQHRDRRRHSRHADDAAVREPVAGPVTRLLAYLGEASHRDLAQPHALAADDARDDHRHVVDHRRAGDQPRRVGRDRGNAELVRRSRASRSASIPNQDDPRAAAIQYRDVRTIATDLGPLLSYIEPSYARNFTLRSNGKSITTFVASASPKSQASITLREGRALTEDDVASGAHVCLTTPQLADKLFKDAPATGQTLDIGPMRCTIVGVYGEVKGSLFSSIAASDVAVIPYTTFHSIASGPVDNLTVYAAPGVTVSRVSDAVDAELAAAARRARAVRHPGQHRADPRLQPSARHHRGRA